MYSDETVPTLLISGTIGSGKTAVLDEITYILQEVDVSPFTALDVDAVTTMHPGAVDDPFNQRLAMANLACL
ncbi:MAG: ATP-binding protein [Actinobacteria bacterium]|nr:ATP-binding protein [Actinomycetota bacterium]